MTMSVIHMKRLCAVITCVATLGACADQQSKPHAHKEAAPEKSTVRLALAPHDALALGKTITIDAKLNDIETRTLLTDSDLEGSGTSKFTLVLTDPTFTDFQRIVPQATPTPGLYSFQFTPKKGGSYRAWVNVTPKTTHTEEFAMAELGVHTPGKMNKVEGHKAIFNGYSFTLAFDKPLTTDDDFTGIITATDKDGKPLDVLPPALDPTQMIIGFYDDYHNVLHGQPATTDKNVLKSGSQGLSFVVSPTHEGFLKLFAQLRIDGKDILVPFVVSVSKAP